MRKIQAVSNIQPDQPEGIIRGRMPTMEMINDRFTRQQSISWTSLLREKIEFSVMGTQIIKFGDFIQKVPVPSSFNLFAMGAVTGNGLYIMDAMLVYLIVDFSSVEKFRRMSNRKAANLHRFKSG